MTYIPITASRRVVNGEIVVFVEPVSRSNGIESEMFVDTGGALIIFFEIQFTEV